MRTPARRLGWARVPSPWKYRGPDR